MPAKHKYLVWALRITVGAVFIFSGFAKAIDPWGLIYKISEYWTVWHLPQLPRSVLLMQSLCLSVGELTLGVLLLVGAMRRAVPWLMAAFMAVMLPLTAYIAVANPVADCGCFGDALVISNTATFLKNIVLAICVIYLMFYNHRVKCLYRPMVQWMPLAATVMFGLAISVIGYNVQPLLDFRPYPVGKQIHSSADDETLAEEMFVYERDGKRQSFSADALPDSTWTFVDRESAPGQSFDAGLAFYDGEDDVTDDMLAGDDLMILVVNNPEYHHIARASMANRIAEVMNERGGDMFAAVAISPDSVASWVEATSAQYPVVVADDTSLKALVRGDAALVYVRDGVITWKTNLYSLPGDFPDDESNLMESIGKDSPVTMLWVMIGLYLAVMVGIHALQYGWNALMSMRLRK